MRKQKVSLNAAEMVEIVWDSILDEENLDSCLRNYFHLEIRKILNPVFYLSISLIKLENTTWPILCCKVLYAANFIFFSIKKGLFQPRKVKVLSLCIPTMTEYKF